MLIFKNAYFQKCLFLKMFIYENVNFGKYLISRQTKHQRPNLKN